MGKLSGLPLTLTGGSRPQRQQRLGLPHPDGKDARSLPTRAGLPHRIFLRNRYYFVLPGGVHDAK